MISWMLRNKRLLMVITATLASLPLLPEWARSVVKAGSDIISGLT